MLLLLAVPVMRIEAQGRKSHWHQPGLRGPSASAKLAALRKRLGGPSSSMQQVPPRDSPMQPVAWLQRRRARRAGARRPLPWPQDCRAGRAHGFRRAVRSPVLAGASRQEPQDKAPAHLTSPAVPPAARQPARPRALPLPTSLLQEAVAAKLLARHMPPHSTCMSYTTALPCSCEPQPSTATRFLNLALRASAELLLTALSRSALWPPG
mmetsp:Transcript_93459/g.154448  ORF Transcript_93459/g.154448 Transcript_93459/m.154448 type:complete len:209 (-) Transcript_93459:96-722(-)